jgi:uncharacterized protein
MGQLKPEENLAHWIAEQYPYVRRIWLYGSRARGDHRARSDIDIAVEITQPDQWARFVTDLEEEAPTLLEIDCVNYDTITGDLKNNIDQEKVLIYERGKI